MAKVSFPILKEQTDGNIILDKTIDVSNLTIEKDGSSYSATITNNGDGTYQFDITESGNYTVKLNGQTQSELEDVYIPAEDNISQGNLATSAGRGDIELNGSDELVLHNGDTVLHEADIVDNLTSTSTTAPLSANQGKELKTLVDAKEAADSTILKESNINSDLTTGGTTKLVSAEVLKTAINPSFSDPTYLSESKTVNENLQRLDNAIAQLTAGGTGNAYRQIFAENKISVDSGGGPADAATLDDWDVGAGSTLDLLRLSFSKKPGETKLIIMFEVEGTSTSSNYTVGYEIDGASVDYSDGNQCSTSYESKSHEFSITGLNTDDMHELCIYFSATGDDINIRKPIILAY